MATEAQCRAALARFTAALAANRGEIRRRANVDRTLACRVTDLGIAFRGRLIDGELRDVTDGDDPDAKIALSATSEDLIALVDGGLDLTRALASRRLVISAGPLDLIALVRLIRSG